MIYNLRERVFLVKKYYEFHSIVDVQRAYRKEFCEKIAPNDSTIRNIISTFEKTGSVHHGNKGTKKPRQKRKDAENTIKSIVSEMPNLSIRKMAQSVDISPTLIFTILHDDLHLKPYKLHKWHKLEHYDYEKRVDFANFFLSLPSDAKYNLICSDEAYFCLTEPKNSQNNRNWCESNPFLGIEYPLHDEKVLVWCAFSAKNIYGPYYFDSSVKKENYLDMLQNYFWELHKNVRGYKKYYFQQDGATPHTANIVQEWLSEKFGSLFIDKTKWPPRSPDLNPCDFFCGVILNLKFTTPYQILLKI